MPQKTNKTCRNVEPQFPLKVYSHKRSGTHLLMATLWQNFKFPDTTLPMKLNRGFKFALDNGVMNAKVDIDIPWGRLWGSHSVYKPRSKNTPSKILYIVRHPIPTLISLWRMMDPSSRKQDLYLNERKIEYWKAHILSYTENCHWIRYEDLVNEKHDDTLETITGWFNLTKKEPKFSRLKERVGWYSFDKPKVGKEPTPEIIELFLKVFLMVFLDTKWISHLRTVKRYTSSDLQQ